MNEAFAQRVEEYKTERQIGDIDLVAEVRQILIQNGLAKEVAEAYDNHPTIIEASRKKPEVQRHLLNRFWNLQLLSVSADTFEDRYCLIPNGDINDWLRLFRSKIALTAVTHRLPKVL